MAKPTPEQRIAELERTIKDIAAKLDPQALRSSMEYTWDPRGTEDVPRVVGSGGNTLGKPAPRFQFPGATVTYDPVTRANVVTLAGGGALPPRFAAIYTANLDDVSGPNAIGQYTRDPTTGGLAFMSPATVGGSVDAYDVAVSADGKNVYLAGNSVINQYSRDADTGHLVAMVPATVGLGGGDGTSITMSPDDAYVYVACPVLSGGSVLQLSRDSTTGALTPLSPFAVPSGSGAPGDVAVSVDGKSLYTADQNGGRLSMFSRDTATGKVTLMSPSTILAGSFPSAVALSPDGKTAYSVARGDSKLFVFDRSLTTGLLTATAAMTPPSTATGPAGSAPRHVVVSPSGGNVYVANQAGNVAQYSRQADGAVFPLSPLTVAAEAGSYAVAISTDERRVYVANRTSNTVSQYNRDTNTGHLSPMAPATISGLYGPAALAIT